MLQEICEYIHNYFIKTPLCGEYVIEGGNISPSLDLKEGQRFWITGSDLNNGVYTYHADGLMNDDDTEAAGLCDESFAGTICALAVPPAVLALTEEINAWVDKNGEASESPYQSENVIGVYSYTKATGGSGAGGAITWKDVFGSRLNRWRKVHFY